MRFAGSRAIPYGAVVTVREMPVFNRDHNCEWRDALEVLAKDWNAEERGSLWTPIPASATFTARQAVREAACAAGAGPASRSHSPSSHSVTLTQKVRSFQPRLSLISPHLRKRAHRRQRLRAFAERVRLCSQTQRSKAALPSLSAPATTSPRTVRTGEGSRFFRSAAAS